MDKTRRVNELLDESASLGIGPAQVSKVEEAVRLADSIGDEELAFGARIELLTAATFAGMPERSLVAFAWLLAKADADPERFDVEQLLFPYRWIVEDVPYLLSVSAERVDALIDDMAERYERHWWWEHPVWEARMRWAMVRGASADEVEGLFVRWRREFARSENRMGGHEVHAAVLALLHMERWSDAIELAQPALDGAFEFEEEYPARTFAVLLQAARHTGDERRVLWRDRAAELCAGNQVFIREVSAIVHDFTVDSASPPTNLFDDLSRWIETSRDEHGIMFASAALAGVGHGDVERHRRRARALASQFDARHENDLVSTRVNDVLAGARSRRG